MNLFTQMLRLVDRFSVEFKSVRAAIAATYGSFLSFYAKYALDIPMYVWGDSYGIRRGDPILPATFTPSLHYLDQLQKRLGLSEIGSLAVGGYTSCMTAAQMLTNLPINADGNPRYPAGQWQLNYRGLVQIDVGKNDSYYGGLRPRSIEGVSQAYNTILALLSSAEIYSDNDVSITYSGTPWTVRYDANYHHGGVAHRGYEGSVATIALQGGETYWLISDATDDDALGVDTCDFLVTIDGESADTWVLSNQMRQTRSGQKLVPAVYKVDLPDPGTHIVEITAVNGNFCLLDAYLKATRTPPPVIFVKQVEFRADAMASWTWTGGGNVDGVLPLNAINALIDDITPNFPNVTVVDPRPGWNPAIHVGFDKLHMSDLGQTYYADCIEAAIPEALTKGTYLIGPTQPLPVGVVVSGTPAPYPPPPVGEDLGEAFTETFNRADNTTSLGTSDVGTPHTWVNEKGVFGIQSGGARCYEYSGLPTGFSMATIDCGGSDGHITMALKVNGGPLYMGMLIRYVDENNFIVAGIGGLTAVVAGVLTTFSFSGPVANADTIIDAYLNDDTIAIGINGVIVCTATMPATAPVSSKHGMVWYGPAGVGSVNWFDYSLTNAPSVAGDIAGGGGGGGDDGGTDEPPVVVDVVLIEDHFSGGDGSSLQPLTGPMPQVLSGTAQVKDGALLVEGVIKYDLPTDDYKVTVLFKTVPVSESILYLRYTDIYNNILVQLVNGNCGQFINGEYRYLGNVGPMTPNSQITASVKATSISISRPSYPAATGTAYVLTGDIALSGGAGTKYDDLYVIEP